MDTPPEKAKIIYPKFKELNEEFHNYIAHLPELFERPEELLFYFPAYVGHVNLGRFLALYEIFRKVRKLNGHVADLGVHRGASMLMFGNLVRLFEPNNYTRVFGYDWFKGMIPGEHDHPSLEGEFPGAQELLDKLIALQGLEGICEVVNVDLTQGLPEYFSDKPWMRFKLVFLDCAIEAVMRESLRHFWPRLVPGGILVLDHYNVVVSPTESDVVDSVTGGLKKRQLPDFRSATAYVVKKGK